jgi:purple acid phosphatase-like protein
MKGLLLRLAIATTVASLLSSNPAVAQVLPPAKRAERVEITQGPEIEMATDHLTIVRWTTNNPGGSDVHYGIVHYGTDPKDVSQTAKSALRLNQGHPRTNFRVRMVGLKPRTTYYYWVTSEESNGKSDGVKSEVKKFTTPGPGERISTRPQSDQGSSPSSRPDAADSAGASPAE